MVIKECPWEKRNLGVHACEIVINDNDLSCDEITTVVSSFDYVVAKLNNYTYKASTILLKNGFIFNETILSISKLVKDFNICNPIIKIYSAKSKVKLIKDIDEINSVAEKLGEDMFSTDRIALNPHFGPSLANVRYSYWIKEMSQDGCDLYEIYYENSIVGFSLVKQNGKITDYILGGLYPQYQDKGLGILTALVPYIIARDNPEKEIKRVITNISSNNLDVIKCYSSLGYVIDNCTYIFTKNN